MYISCKMCVQMIITYIFPKNSVERLSLTEPHLLVHSRRGGEEAGAGQAAGRPEAGLQRQLLLLLRSCAPLAAPGGVPRLLAIDRCLPGPSHHSLVKERVRQGLRT